MKTTLNAFFKKRKTFNSDKRHLYNCIPTISIGYDRKIKYMYTHYEWAITKRGQLGSHRSLMV